MDSTSTVRKVLLASDESESACAGLLARLRSAGFTAERVPSGEEALRRVAREPIAAVLLCTRTLGTAEWLLAGELRALSPTLAILGVTAGCAPDAVPAGAGDVALDALVPAIGGRVPPGLLEATLRGALALRSGGPPAAAAGAATADTDALVEMVAGLVHELNQPLTVMLGTLDVLRGELAAESNAREDLAEIEHGLERLRSIAGQLRAAAQSLRQTGHR